MRSEEDYGCFVGDVDVILRLCLSVCGGGWASEGKQRSQPLLFSHFCIRATQSIQIHILHMDNSVHALCRSAHAASLYARMIGDIQRIIPIQQFKGERNLKNLPALNGYPFNAGRARIRAQTFSIVVSLDRKEFEQWWGHVCIGLGV
jgi:hypothetical protein